MDNISTETLILVIALIALFIALFGKSRASLPFSIAKDPLPKASDAGIKRSNSRAWYLALIAVPLFVALQYFWPIMISWLFGAQSADVAANSGVIIKPFYGLFQLLIALTGAFIIVRWKFPSIDQYVSEATFQDDFKQLTSWQRIGIVSFWLGLLSLLAVWASGTI